jgi:OFA family oxalate/formate antiporter-like MFS transporter
MTDSIQKEPTQAWVTTFAGTSINLCLGILYAWSIWKSALVNVEKAGQQFPADSMNAGWTYLTNAQAATPFTLCVIIFAVFMIPGGKIQDKISPKFGATVGGLLLASGCIIAGLMKSYTGLILGFGILGGMGMGIGYAAPTPAALKWFGPQKRGLVAGLVVGGYGGAALYIGYLGQFLIDKYGVTGSFIGLGSFFCLVVIIAGQLLKTPEEGYVPPGTVATAAEIKAGTGPVKVNNWETSTMMKTWQCWALVFMFILTTQSGLLIISSAKGILSSTAKDIPFFFANAWILVCFGGFVNAAGRVGTGFYSDKIGRTNAYMLNCAVSALCMFALPMVIASKSVPMLFLVVGVAYWQYGGGLALMPSFVGDFFGPKNLGMNYGIVFMGWGFGVFVARLGGWIEDVTGSLNNAFYLSAALLIAGVVLAKILTKPSYSQYHSDPEVERVNV